MAVEYLGPHRSVVLAGGIVARRGQATDVPPDVEERLLSRPDFRPSTSQHDPAPNLFPQPAPDAPDTDQTETADGGDQEE